MTDDGYTVSELLAVMSSRVLEDGDTVFAGVGIPLLAATLAQAMHAPGLTILFEGGVLGPFIVPGELPPSTNEQRCTRRANMVLSNTDVLLLLQRVFQLRPVILYTKLVLKISLYSPVLLKKRRLLIQLVFEMQRKALL